MFGPACGNAVAGDTPVAVDANEADNRFIEILRIVEIDMQLRGVFACKCVAMHADALGRRQLRLDPFVRQPERIITGGGFLIFVRIFRVYPAIERVRRRAVRGIVTICVHAGAFIELAAIGRHENVQHVADAGAGQMSVAEAQQGVVE